MAIGLAKAGFTGNQVTVMGLVASLIYLVVLYFTRNTLLAS